MDAPKALVAHVEPDIARLIQMLLEGQGVTVITAPNGPLAMMRADAHRPDLVVLSARLPDPNHEADGFFVTRYIKGHSGLRGTSVLLLNSDPGPHTTRRAQECRVDQLIDEPFRAVDLLETMQELLAAAAR